MNSSPKNAALNHQLCKICKISNFLHSTTYLHMLRELNDVSDERAKHGSRTTARGFELVDVSLLMLDPTLSSLESLLGLNTNGGNSPPLIATVVPSSLHCDAWELGRYCSFHLVSPITPLQVIQNPATLERFIGNGMQRR